MTEAVLKRVRVPAVDKESQLELHRKLHRQVATEMATGNVTEALKVMDARDTCALALMEHHGMGLAALGANALSLGMQHFLDLVKQGTYALNLGFPSMPENYFKVHWIGACKTVVCRTEKEAWAELGRSWEPYTVYTAHGTVAPQFIPL